MTLHDTTLVEQLSGPEAGSRIGIAFSAQDKARRYIEDSYQRLLRPTEAGPATLVERRAIAAFTAILIGEPATRAHYIGLFRATDPTLAAHTNLIEAEAEGSSRPGPYGRYPDGPLSAEDLDGPVYVAPAHLRRDLGDRIAAAFEYAHLATLHPRDADATALESLARAGWTNGGIAFVVDLVAFIGLQTRIVAGLRAYGAAQQPLLTLVE